MEPHYKQQLGQHNQPNRQFAKTYVLLKFSEASSEAGVLETPRSLSLLEEVDRGLYIENAFKASLMGSVRLRKK